MKNAAHGVDHYENFPVASFLCPPALRPAITAIYWFARTADDLADEGNAQPTERLADLAAYRADLAACAAGQPASNRWPQVFNRLQTVIAQFSLPIDLLADLLSAFEQDVLKTRYASQAELLDYCRRSANPVGRLLLHLYKVTDADSLEQSDCICSALQLINFWQDLGVDIPRGRIYLPQDLMDKHGVRPRDLYEHRVNDGYVALMRELEGIARDLYREGWRGLPRLRGPAQVAVAVAATAYEGILTSLERNGFDNFTMRAHVSGRRKLAMIPSAFLQLRRISSAL